MVRFLGACGILSSLMPTAGLAMQQLRYDLEYPAMGYSRATPTDSVTLLSQRIESGEVKLKFEDPNGYLISILEQLDIDVVSQMLVFSKTSSQIGQILPKTPRAIYFNDEVYVAWVQGGREIEISALDKNLGPVFYTLSQEKGTATALRRETFRCLRCHDSYSMSGGGVPRYLMGSMFSDDSGRTVAHEGWYLTTDQTPLRERWGGWYVTGIHGDQLHMGNLIVTDPSNPKQFDLSRGANVIELGELIDIAPYAGEHSDIVALLVFEHQVYVQNLIIRANWQIRSVLVERPATSADIEKVAEPLVRAMLFVGAAPLSGPIAGTSGFAEWFVRRGPRDPEGRALMELDLNSSLFKYPLSYLIYSASFDALPQSVKDYIYSRLNEVLGGMDRRALFSHLSDGNRQAIFEILKATKPDFAEFSPE